MIKMSEISCKVYYDANVIGYAYKDLLQIASKRIKNHFNNKASETVIIIST